MNKKYFIIYLLIFFLLNTIYLITEFSGEYILLRRGDLSIRKIPEAEINAKVWSESLLIDLDNSVYQIGIWNRTVFRLIIPVIILNFFVILISVLLFFISTKIMNSINRLKNKKDKI